MSNRPDSIVGRTDENKSVTEAIVTQVAISTDRDIIELPPLYETVDPEALETLIHTSSANEAALSVTFNYAGQRITIGPDRTVHVTTGEK
jgi:hypothetical protein